MELWGIVGRVAPTLQNANAGKSILPACIFGVNRRGVCSIGARRSDPTRRAAKTLYSFLIPAPRRWSTLKAETGQNIGMRNVVASESTSASGDREEISQASEH